MLPRANPVSLVPTQPPAPTAIPTGPPKSPPIRRYDPTPTIVPVASYAFGPPPAAVTPTRVTSSAPSPIKNNGFATFEIIPVVPAY